MKICFLLQRRFAYIGHNMALFLKEKYGVKEFCGYVYLRSSYDFLKAQKDIKYTDLLLDEDVHKTYTQEKLDLNYLRWLEKEYGIPNLWPYIALDRIVMFNQLIRDYPYNTPRYSHEEMLRILQVKAKAVIAFLKKENPDAILLPNIGGIGVFLLYHIAKRMGIKTLDVLSAGTQDRYVLSEGYDHFTGVEKILKNKTGQSAQTLLQAKKFLSDFRNQPKTYLTTIEQAAKTMNRKNQLKFLIYPKSIQRSFRWFIKIIAYHFKEKKFGDYSHIHPWHYLIDRIKRKTRNLIGLSDLYDPYNPDEDFAFFPLHLEPEIATLLQAPFYTDQINLIRQIARSLPIHYKLYVKEHPLMVDYRPRSFYKEIKKNPNVKLINPAVSGLKIVAKAKLITVITGTAGWEGIILKKPVITFGYQFYNILSMVKRCREIERLPYIIKEELERPQYNEEELVRLIAAIFEDSIPINLGYLWEQETDELKKKAALEPLADLLAKKLDLKILPRTK